MEKLKTDGLAKLVILSISLQPTMSDVKVRTGRSIGVSNFEIEDLKILLASAKIKPVANQVGILYNPHNSYPGWRDHPLKIFFHPYILGRQAPLVKFGADNGIVSEAYSILTYASTSAAVFYMH